MMSEPNLNAIAQRLVDYSLKHGADEAEIFIQNEDELQIQHKGTLTTNSHITAGIGIRVAIGKQVAFTSSSSLDLASAEREIIEAIKIAKLRDPDPDFRGFPAAQSYHDLDLVSQNILDIQMEDIINELRDARQSSLDLDDRLKNVQGNFSAITGQRAIANSTGLAVAYNRTRYSASFSAVGSYGDHRYSENAFSSGTSYDINLTDIAKDAAQRTIEMLAAQKNVASGTMSVLMEPTAAAIFFIAISRVIFKGNLVLAHRSRFQLDDLDTQVASDKLTFIDDGTLPTGVKASPVDDEGVPSQKTSLIEDGTLKNFLFDYATAKKADMSPTGNVTRGIGHSSRAFTALPNIGARDRIVQPGTRSKEELIAEIDHGVLIGYPQGIFLSNPITTDFTIFPTRVLEIRHGEVQRPVLGVSIHGNGIEWLKKISGIGNDTCVMESMLAPSIVFDNVAVMPVSESKTKKGKTNVKMGMEMP